MSFRQRNKSPENEWFVRSRTLLLETGLPVEVLDDDRRWNYVLSHGDDPESGWSPSWITQDRASDLLKVLGSHYKNPIGLYLFRELEKRINELRGGVVDVLRK